MFFSIAIIAVFAEFYAANNTELQNNGENKKAIVVEAFGVDIERNDFKSKLHLIPGLCSLPLSKKSKVHGTMVMSVIAQGRNKYQFIPVCGDIRRKEFYTQIDGLIKKFSINFVNMSMRFGVNETPAPRVSDANTFREARSALYTTIYHNPKTLFVVASGNGTHRGIIQGGINVDYLPQYPVSNTPDNILSVGSINTDKISTKELDTYCLSKFSNFGIRSVDVLAPGENYKVALHSKSYNYESGTSFATARVFRLALSLSECKRKLTTSQIKELIMKTVYIPDIELAMKFNLSDTSILNTGQLVNYPKLFPVRSGGIIFPERISRAVELLCNNPSISIEKAALMSRKYVPGPGRKNEPEKLSAFWNMREI